ncbi:MAG: amidohydrolase family protein [Desulfobacteraceae bacterium]|jgi:predicted TIM-barrel fold metal-dependent hydrolase
MKFYDAHIHFFFQRPLPDLLDIGVHLEEMGLAGFDALVIDEYPEDLTTIKQMVPEGYHEGITLETFANQKKTFFAFNQASHLKIVPYIDVRFIDTNIPQKIEKYRGLGFKGMKVLYVPEEDNVIGLKGMQEAFGRNRKQSERITSLLIENASKQGMTVLVHADLRRYADFISEMIKGHPTTNFNIPHFGFSRRAISAFLEKYDNCYTDVSSLAAFISKDPRTYLEFISRYQNRILFGSDALIDQPETVQSTMQFFSNFIDDSALSHKILHENYLNFHSA